MEDKLIKNYKLFISVYEDTATEQKIANIVMCLEEGANINATDGNNKHNTPLHIAASRGDKEIVRLLINNGALNQTNSEGKYPIDLACNLIDIHKRTEILEILNTKVKQCAEDLTSKQHVAPQTQHVRKSKKQKKEYLYAKRPGTSGVCGQLYETKLLSLVHLRALNDDEVDKFYLGTNISGIGALDDICMRYKLKGHPRPVIVFVQAKHREDRDKGRLTVEDVRNHTGDFSLPKYFDSYLRIKERFKANNEDDLFEGEFSNVECNLIIYTPVKDNFNKKIKGANTLSPKVNDLIQTGQSGDLFQYQYDDDDVLFLTKITVEDRIKKLGPTFLNFIMAEKDKSETMMTDELIKRYHVVLGREVIEVIEKEPLIETASYTDTKLSHTAKFRQDFFTSNSEYLICLREAFYKEVYSTRCDKTLILKGEILNSIQNVLQNPCAATISEIISKIVTYNVKEKKLELIENNIVKKEIKGNTLILMKQSLKNLTIDYLTIREAIKIRLENIKFLLPTSFGNRDMTLRGSETKVNSRLDTVADKIATLINSSSKTTIEINDDIVGPKKTLEQGFIDINGGIGGAIGNALIQDETTKMIKFDTKNRQPKNADKFLENIKDRITVHELEKVRIRMNINGFPKYSFDGDEYDKRQAKDFLSKLWFYTNQAKEDEVENILKGEINRHYNKDHIQNKFVFRIHSDAIYLRSHDEIQKWWMQPGKAAYLSNASEFFEQAKKEVIDSPLITVLNFMFINKIKNLNVEFNELAIKALEAKIISKGIINVVTKANALSAVKIMQIFHHVESCTFIDFDYILTLPLNDYTTLIEALEYTKVQNLIIIYETLKNNEEFCDKLMQVLKIFKGNSTVIVTDNVLTSPVKEYIDKKYQSIHDDSISLIDLKEDSQQRILNESVLVFQGEELLFSEIIDQKARCLIRANMLNKLLQKDKIEIGHPFTDQIYKDVEDYYTDRTLNRDRTVQVNSFDDIEDSTVVISAKSGMGKSVLLSHLSVNTKKSGSLPWLVRINLFDHEREFKKWQDEKTEIDNKTAMLFLFNVALKNNVSEMNWGLDEDNNDIILTNAEDITDPVQLFEIELFISLLNQGKVMFIFDNFNTICQLYAKEVIGVLTVLKEMGKRMWITTCSYPHMREPLEVILGRSWTLQSIDVTENHDFLANFFSTNMRLEKLNYDQFENMNSFMEISKLLKKQPHRDCVPLLSLISHYAYITAANHFKSDRNHFSLSTLKKLKEKFDVDESVEQSPADGQSDLWKVVFELLLKQDHATNEPGPSTDPILALQDRLHNVIVTSNLNRGNEDPSLKNSPSSSQNSRSEQKSAEDLTESGDSILGSNTEAGALSSVGHVNESSCITADEPRRTPSIAADLPTVVQNVQQMYANRRSIGKTLASCLESGVRSYLRDVKDKQIPENPQRDGGNEGTK